MEFPGEIELLIKYVNNELSSDEREEVELFIKEHKDYACIVQGMISLQRKNALKTGLQSIFSDRKEQMKGGIFKNQFLDDPSTFEKQ